MLQPGQEIDKMSQEGLCPAKESGSAQETK